MMNELSAGLSFDNALLFCCKPDIPQHTHKSCKMLVGHVWYDSGYSNLLK